MKNNLLENGVCVCSGDKNSYRLYFIFIPGLQFERDVYCKSEIIKKHYSRNFSGIITRFKICEWLYFDEFTIFYILSLMLLYNLRINYIGGL